MPEKIEKPIQSRRDLMRQQRVGRAFRERTVIVFPGDDIQKAIDKLDTEEGGNVLLRAGTHTLFGNISGKSEVSIIGEGIDISIIECGGSAYGLDYTGVLATPLKNFRLENFTLQNSNNVAGIDINFCDFWKMEDVKITSCDQGGMRVRNSQNFILMNAQSDNNTTQGFSFIGDGTRKLENFSAYTCKANNNTGVGFLFSATTNLFDFHFFGCISEDNTGDGFDLGNANLSVDASFVGCNSESNGGIGFDVSLGDIQFFGCQADSNTGDGFEIDIASNSIIGCSSLSNGTDYDINSSVAFVGNRLSFGVAVDPSTKYVETDVENMKSLGNVGGNTRTEKISFRMKNTSGVTLNAGDVVVLKAVASGDEVTTTTIQGDDMVFGMVLATMLNNEWGPILVEGYTLKLKVDGTTDIAIGDLIGTFTTAKIAMKAAAGDMAFAVALEAYATNDSLGVINALVIKPRKV